MAESIRSSLRADTLSMTVGTHLGTGNALIWEARLHALVHGRLPGASESPSAGSLPYVSGPIKG